MIEKTIYIADDGTQFEDEEKCVAYENAQLYSDPEIKKELFCFDSHNERYFPASYDDFTELRSFYCETERAYELLKKVEKQCDARYLPFEEDSAEPSEYSEDKVSFVKTHWLWGVNEDIWICLQYERELLKNMIDKENKHIQEEKQKEE